MRLWRLWQGRNRLGCDGQCLLPGAWWPSMATLPTILVVSMAFGLLEVPRLGMFSAYVQVGSITLLVISLGSFLRAGLVDPGFLPRLPALAALSLSSSSRTYAKDVLLMYFRTAVEKANEGVEPEDVEQQASALCEDLLQGLDELPSFGAGEWPPQEAVQRAEEFWHAVRMDSRLKHLKVCSTCDVRRPRGCSHCRECDNCVQDYDHHCHWLGNCVGARNHGAFLVFLLSTSMLSWLIAVFCTGDMVTDIIFYVSSGSAFRLNRANMALGGLLATSITVGAVASWIFYRPFWKKPKKTPQNQHATDKKHPVLAVCWKLLAILALSWMLTAIVAGVISWIPLLLSVAGSAAAYHMSPMVCQQLGNIGRGLTLKQQHERDLADAPPLPPLGLFLEVK